MKTNHLFDVVAVVAALAYSLLMFLSLSGVDAPKEATDQELIAWWSQSGNIRDVYTSMYFMLAAVPFLLLVLVALHARLAPAGDEPLPIATFMLAAGICFAVMLLLAAVSRGVIAHSVRFGGEPLPDADTLRVMTSFMAIVLGLLAMSASTAMIAAASALIIRTRAMPVWVAGAGAVFIVITVPAIAFNIGQFASPLVMLWLIAASIELWRTGRSAPAEARQPVTQSGGHALPG